MACCTPKFQFRTSGYSSFGVTPPMAQGAVLLQSEFVPTKLPKTEVLTAHGTDGRLKLCRLIVSPGPGSIVWVALLSGSPVGIVFTLAPGVMNGLMDGFS